MSRTFPASAGVAALLLMAVGAPAQEPVKVGLLTTLSGPQAAAGEQQRNGFARALIKLGGRFGGREAMVIVRDDERNPEIAAVRAKALVEGDKVDFLVGPAFDDILAAIVRPVTDSGAFLINPGPGSARFAGKECNPNLFVTSFENDQIFQILGEHAQHTRIATGIAIVADDQTGTDAVAGIKRFYRGQILEALRVPSSQRDFAQALAKVTTAKPAAIFVVLPGRVGIDFVKQFRDAGLAETVKFLSAFTLDEAALMDDRAAALGLFGGANWAPNLDNAENLGFVADYEKAYGALPAAAAFQAYDAAMLIDSALKATNGGTADKAALRAALAKADFTSLRGKFRFNTNHYPVQDFYLVKVARRDDGKFQTEIVEKIFADYMDPYARECPMK